MDLSHYIEARRILGYSLEDVALYMKTTKQTISNLELGRTNNQMTEEFYKQTIVTLIKEDNQKRISHLAATVEFMKTCYE